MFNLKVTIMATITKRVDASGKTSYMVQVRLTGFAPETATFSTRTYAKAWATKIEADMREGRHFGANKRHIFADLAKAYEPHAKDKERLTYWIGVFGNSKLDAITPAKIAKQRDQLLTEDTLRYSTRLTGDPVLDASRVKAKRTGATVNRYLASLSSCFTYGVKELQWVEKNPCFNIKKPKESVGRVRFLSDDERTALLKACQVNSDLYLAVVLALSTGARQAEVMTLRFSQIDFQRKIITLTKTKNGETRTIPLVGSAFNLLQERAKVRSLTDDRIFPATRMAKMTVCINLRKPWINALAEAGITDFRWHDLRHTAASYLAMAGVSLVEMSKILGHKTMQMVSRYSHLSDGHIVATGEMLATRLGI